MQISSLCSLFGALRRPTVTLNPPFDTKYLNNTPTRQQCARHHSAHLASRRRYSTRRDHSHITRSPSAKDTSTPRYRLDPESLNKRADFPYFPPHLALQRALTATVKCCSDRHEKGSSGSPSSVPASWPVRSQGPNLEIRLERDQIVIVFSRFSPGDPQIRG